MGLRQAEQLVAAIEICQASMAELDAGLGFTTNARRDLACDDDELKCDYLCIGAGANPNPNLTLTQSSEVQSYSSQNTRG